MDTDQKENLNKEDIDSLTPEFVNLHTHSEYSLLDGAIRINQLVAKVKEFNQPAVALTDHAGLYGCINLYVECKKQDINAIIGSEIYYGGSDLARECVAQYGIDLFDGMIDPEDNPEKFIKTHLAFNCLLYSKNQVGYKRLVKIVSASHVESINESMPVIEMSKMLDLSQDLIFVYSCNGGELSYLVRLLGSSSMMDYDKYKDTLIWQAIKTSIQTCQEKYGKDNVYIELVSNNLADDEEKFLDDLAYVAGIFEVPLVASGNSHYLNPEDKKDHEILLGVRNKFNLADVPNRNPDFFSHLLSTKEAIRLYSKWPSAISNTVKIANECHTEFEFGKFYLPSFELPGNETAEDAVVRMAHEGLQRRLEVRKKIKGEISPERLREYDDRLEYELKIIKQMGFCGYFLIVQDFINWAKDHDIPVGPGRGSGAGSLVAYCLRITDLDPLDHNLIFERFLNPERVSMPDFDVDFCQDRREEVIDYVSRRYGANSTAQITTFGKMKARAVVKNVGRILGLSYSKVDAIAKLIPEDPSIKLKDAFLAEPKIQEELSKEPVLQELMEHCFKLEGINSHSSVHAAGVVISDGPMDDYVPVYQDSGNLITQYEKENAEKVGLVKFDFLGLKTLTVIHKAVKLINSTVNKDFKISEIPLEDKKVYSLISSGNSVGVFQLESSGMKQLLLKLQPSCFADLVALVALFRPGPLQSGMVDDFVDRKHGKKEISYPLPQLEPVLKETYGVIVYQEQVQKIASVLANYTLGEADLLRRAMGKKKPAEMAKQKDRFIEGCKSNGISSDQATEIFDLMAKFAEYGFNKSHSAAYGLVSYQTAYLKTYYPEQFLAAIMSCDIGATDKIVRYTGECRRLGFEIIPPDINSSGLEFTVPAPGKINFALLSIKGVGAQSLSYLIEEREKHGIYSSLEDLAKRVDLHEVGKKTLELLTQAGALDCFGQTRYSLFSSIEELVNYSQAYHYNKSYGQVGLFDSMEDLDSKEDLIGRDDTKLNSLSASDSTGPEKLGSILERKIESLRANEDLAAEEALLGMSLSRSPLLLYKEDQNIFRTVSLSQLLNYPDKKVRSLVSYKGSRIATMKDDRKLRCLSFEDDSGAVQFFVGMDKQFDVDFESLKIGVPLLVCFNIKKGYNSLYRANVESIKTLEEERRSRVSGLELLVDFSKVSLEQDASSINQSIKSKYVGVEDFFKSIKKICEVYRGNCKLKMELKFKECSQTLSLGVGVDLTNNCLQCFKELETPLVFSKDCLKYELQEHLS